MLVSELMNPNVISITPDEPASLAARMLHRYNVGSLPVCSIDGKLHGIVTDRDIVLRCVAAEVDPSQTKVKEIMSRSVVSVQSDEDVREATRLMAENQVRRLPVMDNNRVVGMFSIGDMAKSHLFDMEAAKAFSEISSNIKHI